MELIPKLYEGINFSTIPKCISDELKTHGDIRESISIRNAKGKMITKEGDFMKPLFMFFADLNFYVNSKYLFHLFKLLDMGVCFDTKYNKLNQNNIDIYYNEYSKGFNKGYNEFENSIKDSNTIFSTSNEQIAFKIYSQIKQDGFTNNTGDFKLTNNSLTNKDIESKICLENNIKFIYQITENNFFESGFYGGKFYKAWELILNNPTVFEPIFLKNLSTITEPNKQNNNPKELNKTFLDFLQSINNKEAFSQELKNTFITEKGKSIRAIINIMENKSILIIGAREFKTFYEVLEIFFNRNIGTYQSIQNVKEIEKEISDPIYKKLNPLITKYKTT